MQTILGKRKWTDEQLLQLPRDGQKREVFGGDLVVSPTGFQHGYISSRLLAALMDYALSQRLGVVVDSSTGFRLRNGDCLSPDVSFVRKERLSKDKELTTKFFDGAPDLVVEVLSEGQTCKSVQPKLNAYFAEGTSLAWIVDPASRTVSVHDSPTQSKLLRPDASLTGDPLLPGFRFPIAQLFEIPDFR